MLDNVLGITVRERFLIDKADEIGGPALRRRKALRSTNCARREARDRVAKARAVESSQALQRPLQGPLLPCLRRYPHSVKASVPLPAASATLPITSALARKGVTRVDAAIRAGAGCARQALSVGLKLAQARPAPVSSLQAVNVLSGGGV